MKTVRVISPQQFSPIGSWLLKPLVSIPIVVPTAAWLWNKAEPESLWQFAEQLRPFSLSVTARVAMPMVYDTDRPVHDMVYALLLVGWTLLVPLQATLLFRFRRHIPVWVRSWQARKITVALNERSCSLPFISLIWLAILLDILFFGRIVALAELVIPRFGQSMFCLGGAFTVFYGATLMIAQRIMFRIYRDRSVKQVGIGR